MLMKMKTLLTWMTKRRESRKRLEEFKHQYMCEWVPPEPEIVRVGKHMSDVQVALMFFDSLDSITLVVDKYEYVPYVRRALVRELGEPSKAYGDAFYYGGKPIHMVSKLNEARIVGIPREQVFYVENVF